MSIETITTNSQLSDILTEFGFSSSIDKVEIKRSGNSIIIKPIQHTTSDNTNRFTDFMNDIKCGVSDDFMQHRIQPALDIREEI